MHHWTSVTLNLEFVIDTESFLTVET